MVIALCLGVTSMHIGLVSVGVALADVQEKQEASQALGIQVLEIKEILIRNESAILYLKEDASHLREGQKMMLDDIANTRHYPN